MLYSEQDKISSDRQLQYSFGYITTGATTTTNKRQQMPVRSTPEDNSSCDLKKLSGKHGCRDVLATSPPTSSASNSVEFKRVRCCSFTLCLSHGHICFDPGHQCLQSALHFIAADALLVHSLSLVVSRFLSLSRRCSMHLQNSQCHICFVFSCCLRGAHLFKMQPIH